jgi:hypothetical protein
MFLEGILIPVAEVFNIFWIGLTGYLQILGSEIAANVN